jgi:hypothetical protein
MHPILEHQKYKANINRTKGEKESIKIIVGDFNSILLTKDRSPIQKINKERAELNCILKEHTSMEHSIKSHRVHILLSSM